MDVFLSQVVEVPNCSWEDIGGLENVKRELQEVIRLVCPSKNLMLNTSIMLATLALAHSFWSFCHVDCSISCGASREVREVWYVTFKGSSFLWPTWMWENSAGQGNCQ